MPREAAMSVPARLCGLFLMILVAVPAGAAAKPGVLLLHGKTGMPGQMQALAGALRNAGYIVGAPEMCWSRRRIYDRDLGGCLADIDAAIARLKGEGATDVVLGGTSLGAMVALDYAAAHPGLAGVIAIVPAADPADTANYPALAAGVRHAETLIAAGQGDVTTQLSDIVTGNTALMVKATPNAYMSFHGANSPVATVTRGLAAMVMPKVTVPCLWVAATRDPSQQSAATIFARLPHNPLDQLAQVDSDHAGAPDAAGSVVTTWLARVGGP